MSLGHYQRELSRLLRTLGPQLSLFAVNLDGLELEPCDDDGTWDEFRFGSEDQTLISGKSLLVLKKLTEGNIYSSTICDLVESFNAQFGTGTSSLLSWIVLLLDHAIKSNDIQSTFTLIDEFEALYVSTAEALAIDMEGLLLSSNEREEFCVQGQSECFDDHESLVDDMSWFFAQESSTVASSTAIDSRLFAMHADNQVDCAKREGDVKPVEIPSPIKDPKRWCEERITTALQHCLVSDFPPSQGKIDSGTCLPMIFALQAVRPLLCQAPDGVAGILLQKPNSVINIIVAPGCSSNHSQVVAGGLFFRLSLSLCNLAAKSGLQTEHDVIHISKHRRALCLDLPSLIPGTSGTGGGVSTSAGSMQAIHYLKLECSPSATALFDPLNPQSLQFSPSALYHSKLVAKMKSLNVSLLVVPLEAVSQQMIDLFATNEWSLVPVPMHLLSHAALVLGCTLVGDVLDAADEHCSRSPCDLSILPFGQSATHSLVRLSRCIHDSNGTGHAENSSVLLCAPTLAQARSWQDRFWRCVRRLALGYTNSALVPSGLIEVVSMILLKNRLEQSRGQDSTKLKWYNSHSDLLYKFLAVVASNAFGLDGAQLDIEIQNSIAALSTIIPTLVKSTPLSCHSLPNLTNDEKLSLWQHAPFSSTLQSSVVDEPGDSLDICAIKTEALRMAITGVKLLLMSSIP